MQCSLSLNLCSDVREGVNVGFSPKDVSKRVDFKSQSSASILSSAQRIINKLRSVFWLVFVFIFILTGLPRGGPAVDCLARPTPGRTILLLVEH